VYGVPKRLDASLKMYARSTAMRHQLWRCHPQMLKRADDLVAGLLRVLRHGRSARRLESDWLCDVLPPRSPESLQIRLAR
jgi:hypothetical protein